MSLGSAILRPQALATPPGNGGMRAIDLVVELVETLVKDPAVTTAAGAAMAEVLVPRLETFLLTRFERMRLAEGRMRNIFAPFTDVFTAFIDSMDDGITDTLPGAIEALRGLVGLIGTENLGQMLRELIDLAETDLEINGEAVEDLFREIMGATVTNLRQAANDGDLSEEALARYEMGTHLLSLEQLLLEELEWPSLDKDILVEALADIGRQSGYDRVLDDLERLLGSLLDLIEPLANILETAFSIGVDVEVSTGDDGDGHRSLGAAANGETTVTDTSPVSFYATWVLRTEARFTIDETTTRIGPIAAITYKNLTPRQMEQAAFHTLWIADLVESLLHFISAEDHDVLVNILNGTWNLGNTIATPLAKKQLPNWVHWVVMPPMTFFGGFESGRFKDAFGDDPYLWTILLGDIGETVLYRRWVWLAREFVLSTMTMANHDPEAYASWKTAREQGDLTQATAEVARLEVETTDLTLNYSSTKVTVLKEELKEAEADVARIRFDIRQGGHNQFHGFCYGFSEVFGVLLPLILGYTDRLNYGFIGGGLTWPLVGKAFGGFGISVSAGYLSLLLARPIAGEWADDGTNIALIPFKERFVWNPKRGTAGLGWARFFWALGNGVVEWAMQGIYLYLFTNGNTSDGKFAALDGDFEFLGNPENPEGSPYRLPYPSGEIKECVQNPLGIWSHFPDSGQTYAIDFNHNAGDDVSNSRTGVITSITMDHENNNPDRGNAIEVMALRVLPAGTTGDGVFPGVAVPPPQPVPATNPPTPPNPPLAYADSGTIAIEPGTLFPPYWDVNGKPWPLVPDPMPLHPSQAILPPGSALADGVDADSMFAFLDPSYDRGMKGVTYPPGATFSDGTTPIPLGVVFAPDAPKPPLSTPFYLAGTTFAMLYENFDTEAFLTGPDAVAAGVPGITPDPGDTFLDGRLIPAGVEFPRTVSPIRRPVPPGCLARTRRPRCIFRGRCSCRSTRTRSSTRAPGSSTRAPGSYP